MLRAAAEHTSPDGNVRKAWHSYSYATDAYISDCRQVVIALSVVVVKLASLALGGPRR